MQWVRIHPIISNWPGGGPPPTFNISADENGTVVIELAWDPQALSAPATYADPLRYYNTSIAFSATMTNDNGSTRPINIPVQTIQLNGNRATWTIPQALWDAYVEESLKRLRTPATTTFSGNIYCRVRAIAPGASQAQIWPEDGVLRGANADKAPHIYILPISASPSSQVVPDQAAVAAMGGVPGIAPTLWSDLLSIYWRALPESDPNRQALVRIFAHPVFQSADLPTRAAILKLWILAGTGARPRLPQLLDRNTVVGSNMVQPIISKRDLRTGKTLIENLLALLDIVPHPDLARIMSKDHLFDQVVLEILDPNGQINQGAADTCVPTSLQTLLITLNPSEYARLQCGLLSASARASLSNNAMVDVPVGIFQAARYATIAGQPFLLRTYSELAFQAAIIKYAKGPRFPALTGTAQNINDIFQATVRGGLYPSEIKLVLDGLFNVNFTAHNLGAPYQPGNAAWLASQRALRDGLVNDLPTRQQQMIFAMFWSAPYGTPPNGGAHAVMGVRREASGGRVFYKNPQYPGSHPTPGIIQGGGSANPPRRFEDPSQSLESITEADLATWILSYWVPDQVII